VLAPEAMYGLSGKVVRLFDPHTEADPVAVLMQFQTSFGNAIGRSAYYMTEGTPHYTNLYDALVGKSAKSRKGTAGDRVRQVTVVIDPDWASTRIKSGLSSGEGLVDAVRDPKDDNNDNGDYFTSIDKRLLIDLREFSSALAVMKRAGNTLSPILRDAWDGKDLGFMTRQNKVRSSKPHISIVGHITIDELISMLDRTDMANGFANRFRFACVPIKRTATRWFSQTVSHRYSRQRNQSGLQQSLCCQPRDHDGQRGVQFVERCLSRSQ
jgi:hypothetical protein